MIEVPVYNTDGKQVNTLQVEESLFGTTVNCDLVKQAVVTYHANKRQGSAKTKSRSELAYSTKKMYRQKGTGNARRGSRRSGGLRGGGHIFAKQVRDFRKKLPQKMRQAATRSAILAKLIGGDLLVLEGLACTEPQTKVMAGILTNLGINRSCLLALAERDKNVYLSSRNLADLTVRITEELNAYDVATRQKMIVTSDAMTQLCKQEA